MISLHQVIPSCSVVSNTLMMMIVMLFLDRFKKFTAFIEFLDIHCKPLSANLTILTKFKWCCSLCCSFSIKRGFYVADADRKTNYGIRDDCIMERWCLNIVEKMMTLQQQEYPNNHVYNI